MHTNAQHASNVSNVELAPQERSPQNSFREAARQGSVSGMKKACEEGACPTLPGRRHDRTDVTAWHIVTLHAPAASLKACFAFLKNMNVSTGTHAASTQEFEHPFFHLLSRATRTPQKLGGALWRLWLCLEKEEQQKLVHAEDLFAYGGEVNVLDIRSYRASFAKIWTTPFKHPTPFRSTIYTEAQDSIAHLFEDGAHHDPRLTPAVVLFLVRSISCASLDGKDMGWGALCTRTPAFILKACFHNAAVVDLLHKNLTSSLNLFIKEGLHTNPHLQKTCILLLRRFHNAGLRWPDQWPEETQEALCALPEVRAWLDKRALEKALPPSPTARRARV